MSVGSIMAGITYVTQVIMSVMMVTMLFNSISRAIASGKRISEIMDSDPAIKSGDKNGEANDTVISFERNDEEIRFLRAQKNRFGSTDELGIFSMTERGLCPLEDPSSLFITRRDDTMPPGVALVPVFEGSRVFLVEIQALTVPAKASFTRVYSDNIDNARVSRIAAVLEKRLGLRFSDQDIYINVAGGVRLTESAIDGALAAALYSARTDLPLPSKTAIAGELSLAGELRPVNRLKQRIKAANGLGYKNVFTPEKEENALVVKDIKSLVSKLFLEK